MTIISDSTALILSHFDRDFQKKNTIFPVLPEGVSKLILATFGFIG
jgi:hypothetical protein